MDFKNMWWYQWKELKQVHVLYEDTLVSDGATIIHRIPVQSGCRLPDTHAMLSGYEHLASLNHVFAHASRRARFAVVIDDGISNRVFGVL